MALTRWQAVGDDLLAGVEPEVYRSEPDVMTLRDLANAYESQVRNNVKRGRIKVRHQQDVHRTLVFLLKRFGPERPVDAVHVSDWTAWANDMRDRWNDTTMSNHVKRIRTAFNWAYQSALIDKPMRFGPEFKTRVARKPKDTYNAAEIRTLIDHGSVALRAMVLLGINGGYGNTDCSALTIPEVQGDVIETPRKKTQIARCVPLWGRTASTVAEAIEVRPRPASRSYAAHVFLTKRGQPWVDRERGRDAVSQQFGKLATACGVRSLGFYALRRTFRTVADGAGDQRAADVVMGHVTPGMSGVYVQSVERARLDAVVGHVEDWLFGTSGK